MGFAEEDGGFGEQAEFGNEVGGGDVGVGLFRVGGIAV